MDTLIKEKLELDFGFDRNCYDLILVGAGVGGSVCAIKAASLGLKVAVLDQQSPLANIKSVSKLFGADLFASKGSELEDKILSLYDFYKIDYLKLQVKNILHPNSNYKEVCAGQYRFKSKYVVLASGLNYSKSGFLFEDLKNILKVGSEETILLVSDLLGLRCIQYLNPENKLTVILSKQFLFYPFLEQLKVYYKNVRFKVCDVLNIDYSEKIKLVCFEPEKAELLEIYAQSLIDLSKRSLNVDFFNKEEKIQLTEDLLWVKESGETNFNGIYALGALVDNTSSFESCCFQAANIISDIFARV